MGVGGVEHFQPPREVEFRASPGTKGTGGPKMAFLRENWLAPWSKADPLGRGGGAAQGNHLQPLGVGEKKPGLQCQL